MSKFFDYFRHINDYKFSSLFFKNFALISLIVIIPLTVISMTFINYLSQSFYKEMTISSKAQLNKYQYLIDNKLSELNKACSRLTLNSDITEFMLFENNSTKESVTSELKYICNIFDYIDSITFYSAINNNIFSSNDSVVDEPAVKKLYSKATAQKYYYEYSKNENYYTDYLILVKPVFLDDNTSIGALFINISLYDLNKIINLDRTTDVIYLLDKNGNVVCGPDNIGNPYTDIKLLSAMNINEIENETIRNHNDIISTQKSTINDMQYVYINTTSSFILSHWYIIFIIAFLILIVDLVVSMLITVRTYKPIYSILNVLDENYNTQTKNKAIKIKTSNELSYIISSLEALKQENLNISLNLDKTLTTLNQMHYNLVHSQISSHFLSNTLQAINFLAYDLTNSENNVTISLRKLSQLYGILTHTDSFLVSLRDELDYTKIYLELMALKYSDSFTVDYNIDESTLYAKIPKLCLQPIIENSFCHGFYSETGDNHFKIDVHKASNYIEVIISDNGIGLTESELEQIRHDIDNIDYSSGDNHIALRNISKRLKLCFGDKYGLKINSQYCEGTSVHILIPA